MHSRPLGTGGGEGGAVSAPYFQAPDGFHMTYAVQFALVGLNDSTVMPVGAEAICGLSVQVKGWFWHLREGEELCAVCQREVQRIPPPGMA